MREFAFSMCMYHKSKYACYFIKFHERAKNAMKTIKVKPINRVKESLKIDASMMRKKV